MVSFGDDCVICLQVTVCVFNPLLKGICKLPFIDEDRLLSATNKIENELSGEEAKRNMENLDQLFVHSSENFASRIISSFNDVGLIKQDGNSIKIDSDLMLYRT